MDRKSAVDASFCIDDSRDSLQMLQKRRLVHTLEDISWSKVALRFVELWTCEAADVARASDVYCIQYNYRYTDSHDCKFSYLQSDLARVWRRLMDNRKFKKKILSRCGRFSFEILTRSVWSWRAYCYEVNTKVSMRHLYFHLPAWDSKSLGAVDDMTSPNKKLYFIHW